MVSYWPPQFMDTQQEVRLADHNRVLQLHGSIDEGMVSKIENLDLTSLKIVHISSLGGTNDAALEVAALISKKRPVIYIDGPCLSACAQFIVPSGKRTYARKGAVLLFHNTSTSILAITGNYQLGALGHAYEQRAREEKSLYLDDGVSQNLLVMPQQLVQTQCFVIRSNPAGEQDVFYKSRYEAAFFSIKQLRGFGISISGSLPKNAASVSLMLTKAVKRSVPPTKFIQSGNYQLRSFGTAVLLPAPLC